MTDVHFADRADAGRRVAGLLLGLSEKHPVVLGLARGGVLVATEVARALGAELDVLVVRKVGAPNHPEYGIGAVAPGGIRYFDEIAVAALGLSYDELDALARGEEVEVRRRLTAYRGNTSDLDLRDRYVVIVDDGLATGVTAVAAARYAKALGAAYVVLAAPVCSSQSAEKLAREVDEMACVSEPTMFYAVGQWYEHFSQTTDEEVKAALEASALNRARR